MWKAATGSYEEYTDTQLQALATAVVFYRASDRGGSKKHCSSKTLPELCTMTRLQVSLNYNAVSQVLLLTDTDSSTTRSPDLLSVTRLHLPLLLRWSYCRNLSLIQMVELQMSLDLLIWVMPTLTLVEPGRISRLP